MVTLELMQAPITLIYNYPFYVLRGCTEISGVNCILLERIANRNNAPLQSFFKLSTFAWPCTFNVMGNPQHHSIVSISAFTD